MSIKITTDVFCTTCPTQRRLCARLAHDRRAGRMPGLRRRDDDVMSACNDCHADTDIVVVLRRDADAMDDGSLSGWSEHLRIAADELEYVRLQRSKFAGRCGSLTDHGRRSARIRSHLGREVRRLCDIIIRSRDAHGPPCCDNDPPCESRRILDEMDGGFT